MSDYLVVVARIAQKQLASLPIEVSSRIEIRIEDLIKDPRPPGCIKLKGKTDRWRVRVGDYRIIYSIDDTNLTIKIIKVSHRREAYDR